MTITRGRLAPSPTGGLHVGNVRTLMLAWLSARAAGGVVVLRIEDLDPARCKPGYTDQLIADLRWLGFDWDEGPAGGPYASYLQSQRNDSYRGALDRLIAIGRAYPCICSRAGLAGSAGAPHGPDGTVYPGTCRGRFPDAAAARAHGGREPAWRFNSMDLVSQPWQDCFIDGEMPALVDDFILYRADGVPSYQLAVATDDQAMDITEIVRGDDLVSSTPRQLALMQALGRGARPRYFHVPLVLDGGGQRLAKRSGATQVAELRRRSVEPEALLAFLAHGLGYHDVPPACSLTELVAAFNWRQVPTSPVIIRESDLMALVRS